jgi:serine/threonine protein kinase
VTTSLVGRKLSKYEITALVGKGGMATVYKGYQSEIDRYVAIKVLPPHPGQDEQFIERFRLEARTIARLQHPHILPLYDYGTEADVLYLVMAFIDGGSLHDRIRRHGALPLGEVERLLSQVGSALDYAHRQGIIHRDIKPDNILLDREGFALLADFGIVKIVEAGGGGLTVTGGLMGTPAYISPEQGQGLPIDHRSDLYSLGVVLYEMLTGKQPYTADTPMQLVFKQINAPVPDVRALRPDFSESLALVLRRALAKSPDDRYDTASALLTDFKRALDENGGATLLDPNGTGFRLNTAAPPTNAHAHTPIPTPILNPSSARPPITGETRADSPTPMNLPPDSSTPTSMGNLSTGTMQPTMIAQAGWNPLILLVGLVIIGLLVVILVVILLNFSRPTDQVVVAPPDSITQIATPTANILTRIPTVIAALPPAAPTYGRLSFGTTRTPGDTVNLRADGLRPPDGGAVYVAWLMPLAPDTPPLKLGELAVDSLGEGILTFMTEAGRVENLATDYFAVVVTRETTMNDRLPNGEIVYSGIIPQEVPGALREILTTSPDGFDGRSLLDGAITEARIARQHSGLAAGANTPGAMHTHAEHTINILNGRQEDYTGDGRGQNPGRGVGVFFFLDAISTMLDAAATAPNADNAMQAQIELIRVCVNNVRGWANEVVALELELAAAATLEEVATQREQSTVLAAALIDGIDLNANGQVEPFEGECGLNQITTYGIAVSNMDLREGAPPILAAMVESAVNNPLIVEATPDLAPAEATMETNANTDSDIDNQPTYDPNW